MSLRIGLLLLFFLLLFPPLLCYQIVAAAVAADEPAVALACMYASMRAANAGSLSVSSSLNFSRS